MAMKLQYLHSLTFRNLKMILENSNFQCNHSNILITIEVTYKIPKYYNKTKISLIDLEYAIFLSLALSRSNAKILKVRTIDFIKQ